MFFNRTGRKVLEMQVGNNLYSVRKDCLYDVCAAYLLITRHGIYLVKEQPTVFASTAAQEHNSTIFFHTRKD